MLGRIVEDADRCRNPSALHQLHSEGEAELIVVVWEFMPSRECCLVRLVLSVFFLAGGLLLRPFLHLFWCRLGSLWSTFILVDASLPVLDGSFDIIGRAGIAALPHDIEQQSNCSSHQYGGMA